MLASGEQRRVFVLTQHGARNIMLFALVHRTRLQHITRRTFTPLHQKLQASSGNVLVVAVVAMSLWQGWHVPRMLRSRSAMGRRDVMRTYMLMCALFLTALLLVPMATTEQQPTGFQYVVKFLCGKSPGNVVALGVYCTAINVHSPSTTSPIDFRKNFALALPEEKPGWVSQVFGARLGHDEALEIDCPDIMRHTQTTDD
jgi:hypothetical protein